MLSDQISEKFGKLGFSGHGKNAYDSLQIYGLIARHEINGGVNILRVIWVPQNLKFRDKIAYYGLISFDELMQRSTIIWQRDPGGDQCILLDEYEFFEKFLHTTRAQWEARKDVDSYISRLFDLYMYWGQELFIEKYERIPFEELLKLDIEDIYLEQFRHYRAIK